MKLFGWGLILGGCLLFARGIPDGRWVTPLTYSHAMMGFFFGLLHLAYGTYLYFTEKHRNET